MWSISVLFTFFPIFYVGRSIARPFTLPVTQPLLLFFRFDAELELITALGTGNREGHVDAAQNVVRVGLAVEESLAFIVSLKRKCMKWLTILRWSFKSIIWK